MLTIRLQRAGKKNKPQYRLVLADKTAASQKKFTEVLGSYNPHTKELVIRDQARLDYWMKEQHVGLSATANNLLITKGIVQGTKTKAFTIPKKEVVAEEVAPETQSSETAPEPTPEVAEAPVEESAPAEEKTEEAAPEVAEQPAEEAPAETEAEAEQA